MSLLRFTTGGFMYRRILVPLDGSHFGEHALPLALGLARRAGAKLEVVHVYTPLATAYSEHPVWNDDTLEALLKKRHQDYLDHTAGRLAKVSPVSVSLVVLEGGVVEEICAHVEKTGVDLVVMTTHGRGPLGRFWLGSVADALARQSPVPVLLVRPGEAAPDLCREPVAQHILLPLDGSDLAEQMLGPAVELGSLADADYTLLRVIKPVLPTLTHPMAFPMEGASLAQLTQETLDQLETANERLGREAQDYLDRVAERLQARGLRIQTRVATEQQPATAVLEAAATGIDLIALETHGRRGLARLLLGSVADKVVRGSHLPVLVHHPSKRSEEIPAIRGVNRPHEEGQT
jgi:nucleotide-binding universal stress UspA family protein